MDSELFEIIIPSVAFFVAFFLVFTLLEMMIVLLLNGFVYHHWSFVADVVMRVKVRHGKLARFITLTAVIVFIVLLVQYTAVVDVLRSASIEEKLYAAQILLVILLTYLIATRHLAKLDFLKQIHRYLYIYLSTITYVFMVLLVHSQYLNYQQYIRATIIVPIQKNVDIILENRVRQELLKEFRLQIYNKRCPRVDLTTEMIEGTARHFIYVTTHPDLSLIKEVIDEDASKNYLVGRLCTNGTDSFLLTNYGQWYWVIDQ